MKDNALTNNIISSLLIYEKTNVIDLNDDFTLPDYLPEIRRLLLVKPNILPPSTAINDQKIDFNSDIKYKILYVGNDNQIYSYEVQKDYSFNFNIENQYQNVNTNDVSLCVNNHLDSIQNKVLAPRKINIKAKITFFTKCFAPFVYELKKNNFEENETLEIKTKKIDQMKSICQKSEILTLHDFLPIERGIDSTRIIDTNAEVFVNSISYNENSIEISGNVLLDVLFYNDGMGQTPILTARKIAFSEKLEVNGIDKSFDTCVLGFIDSINAEIEEDGIDFEIFYGLTLDARTNKIFEYAVDAYSTTNDTTLNYENINVLKNCILVSRNYSQNEIIQPKKVSIDPDAKVIYTFADVSSVEDTVKNNVYEIKGSINYSVIYYLNGEYGISNFNQPFKYEFDNCIDSNMSSVYASVLSCYSKNDGEKLSVQTELQICYCKTKSDNINLVAEITFNDKFEKEDGAFIIYYPDKNDTLFDIAKRYKTSVSSIKETNGIQNDETKKYLII